MPAGPGPVDGVVLVMHGGKESSREPTSATSLPVVRMRPFARALEAGRGTHRFVVWSVRFRVRGWNGDEMSPVADVRQALEQVRVAHGDVPVVLVGHSMGGRAALRAAGGAARTVVALAPWLPAGEPFAQLDGCQVLIVHGSSDRVTSPRRSREFATEAAAVADRVWWVEMRGSGHAMVRRARRWHELTSEFVLSALAGEAMPDVLDTGTARATTGPVVLSI